LGGWADGRHLSCASTALQALAQNTVVDVRRRRRIANKVKAETRAEISCKSPCKRRRIGSAMLIYGIRQMTRLSHRNSSRA